MRRSAVKSVRWLFIGEFSLATILGRLAPYAPVTLFVLPATPAGARRIAPDLARIAHLNHSCPVPLARCAGAG